MPLSLSNSLCREQPHQGWHGKVVQNPSPPKPTTCPNLSTPAHDPLLYCQIVGALQYLSITRPDIQFTTNLLCQHLHNPLPTHFLFLKRILQYLQGTTNLALPVTTDNLTLHSYVDANWASDATDCRSTTSFCSFLGSTLISCQVKKQPTVAKSSTEAEYRCQDIIDLGSSAP